METEVAADRRLVIVDGSMVAGWRREKPSLAQLHQAMFHLHVSHPEVQVAVVADPSLKHALPNNETTRIDADIELHAVVLAPAGTRGGWTEFLTAAVRRAEAMDLEPVVVTDRRVTGANLGKARLDGGRWVFDL